MQFPSHLAKLPANFLRVSGIIYALITACVAQVWFISQDKLFNTDCDRPLKIDSKFDWETVIVCGVLAASPLLLARSRKILNLCLWIETAYLSIINAGAILTFYSEDWECYTMGGSTNFGENELLPTLFGLLIAGVLILVAGSNRLQFWFRKFRKRITHAQN